ncbi:hypothetical protein KW795_02710 [Candidatus Microgenomates bacterium]|nr:hypothetical protein [Candidatus Microgenomates bacterium]
MSALIKVKLYYCVIVHHDSTFNVAFFKTQRELEKREKYENEVGAFNQVVLSGRKELEIDTYGNIQNRLDFVYLDENDKSVFSV